MSVKEKLQIILITYNRAKHVQKTFEQLFYSGSPVYDYECLVLDNNSTDNTFEIVKEWQKTFQNIKYIKNRYNIGLSGNICKAMEIADKEYLWTISDDDKIDLSNWDELETAINNNEELIYVARYALPEEHKNEPAWWLQQATFIPGFVIKTSLFDNDTIKNAFDNIYTLFPHLCPILKFINDNKKPYILSKWLVDAGALHNLCADDLSYTRGSNMDNTYLRTRCMSWIVGYANILSILKDEKLKHEIMRTAIKCIHSSEEKFVMDMMWFYRKELSFMFLDTFLQSPPDIQKKLNKKINWNNLLGNYSWIRYNYYRVMQIITFGNLRKYFSQQRKVQKAKKSGVV